MSESCNHDCSNCSANCGERKDPQSFLEEVNRYSTVKKVIAVVSGKGGVGKSLVTSLLATMTARRGHSTAILDADITGPSIPNVFGVHGGVVGDDMGIYPAETEGGVKLMSINLLLENETDPVVWRGPV
ncbi:MAG: P-loop NTPase, partial [Clostridia bacterium]|nr:P-loop NTPase [Clostridia bacterium]